MTVYTHQLDRNKHGKFLDEQRSDPVTKNRFKHGDRIVFCAVCKSAFLEDSWHYLRGKHCNQHGTLPNFSSDLETISDSITNKSKEKKLLEFPKYKFRMTKFNCLTGKSMDAILSAKEEALQVGHNFVGAEQILVGLLKGDTGNAAQVLKSYGITLGRVRSEILEIDGPVNTLAPDDCWFTPKAFRILELSIREMKQSGYRYADTEHLLLGIIDERNNEGINI